METMIYIFVLFKAIKHYMKTDQKIVNNLINENISPLRVSLAHLIKTRWVIFDDKQFISQHTFNIIHQLIYVS